MRIYSTNPATGTVNKRFSTISEKDALHIAASASATFDSWKKTPLQERLSHLTKLARVLRTNNRRYARLITAEMGKPIKQALNEIEKCAWAAEVYAKHTQLWLKDERIAIGAEKSIVAIEPLGVILCVMPWNYPFWQVLRCAIPALAAGNAVLLRHSNKVPMCALAIEEALKKAGFPDHLFHTLITDYGTVATLIQSRFTSGVSVTGSVDTGIQIANQSAGALKKCVLELGGSDPFIVLKDAEMGKAIEGAVSGRLTNSGQSCVSAKRFIIVKSRYEEFAEGLTERFRQVKIGDPMDKNTVVGPLASREQLAAIEAQVGDAVRKGAIIRTGGKRLIGKGFFYIPTVITGAKPNMRVMREEVFGPVASLIAAKDEDEAITIANATQFGLGASIWTKNRINGERIARRIEAGNVFVNSVVHSDPRLPFGGIKQSGIGRELSRYGLLEFANIKAIVINR